MKTVAVIPARGGSKGIPRKNLATFCGHPLLYWSVHQAVEANEIDEVYVTSDDDEILNLASEWGARPIMRPPELSSDKASSESAWTHAIDYIEKTSEVELCVGMQATSPIRTSKDLDAAIFHLRHNKLDSLFAASAISDFFIWQKKGNEILSMNYDYQNRKPRQDIDGQVVENGSFYIFTPEGIREHQNRLFGKVGYFEMELWKCFEIDELEDIEFCELIMKHYILGKR